MNTEDLSAAAVALWNAGCRHPTDDTRSKIWKLEHVLWSVIRTVGDEDAAINELLDIHDFVIGRIK